MSPELADPPCPGSRRRRNLAGADGRQKKYHPDQSRQISRRECHAVEICRLKSMHVNTGDTNALVAASLVGFPRASAAIDDWPGYLNNLAMPTLIKLHRTGWI